MEFPEEINKERAEFLLSLSDTEFAKLVWTGDDMENNKGEKFLKKADYIAGARKFLKCAIEQDCKMTQKYNYSKSMMTNGRLFSQGFTLQSCKKNLRGFLAGDKYKDYDLKNAHFSIVAMIIDDVMGGKKFKKEFPNIQYLTSSQTRRQKMYDRCDMTKHDALTMLNSKYETSIDNDYARMFDNECKKVQELFWDNTPEQLVQYEHFKQPRAKNKKGSFLNKILCIYENKIINEVINYYKKEYPTNNPVATLMFDGLFISNELPDQTDILNSLFSDEDNECKLINWDIKPPNDEIVKSDLYINRDELPKYERRDYLTVKKSFEKDHFMILDPVVFGYESTLGGKPIVCLNNRQDFKLITQPIKYEIFRHGRIEEINIFQEWLNDETRRHYKKLDFVPTEERSDEIYNTFTGFDYSNYKNVDYVESTELIELFKKTVSTLVDNNDECVDYVLKYFAHLFQQPEVRPNVSLVFVSLEGYGKDTLIDCVQVLLGRQYLYRTAKIDDIFGSFNSALKNKLIVQINELAGRDGFENKDKLKDLITQQTVNINEKNKPQYDQTNYSRIIICTNRFNSIEISPTDRRFFVAEADRIKPPKSHFIKFHQLLKDDNQLYSLYKYFMEYKIGNIPLDECRPLTNAYNNMRENNIHPYYIWLKDALTDYKVKDEYGCDILEHQTHRASSQVVIKSTVLFDGYSKYMEDNDQPMNKFTQKRTMKDMLSSLKVINKKTKLNGSVVSAYWFNIPVILKYLQDIVKEEAMKEYTDADFE